MRQQRGSGATGGGMRSIEPSANVPAVAHIVLAWIPTWILRGSRKLTRCGKGGQLLLARRAPHMYVQVRNGCRDGVALVPMYLCRAVSEATVKTLRHGPCS